MVEQFGLAMIPGFAWGAFYCEVKKENAMNAYGALAKSYDRLTGDVDYRDFVDFAHEILKKENLSPRTVADLA